MVTYYSNAGVSVMFGLTYYDILNGEIYSHDSYGMDF